MKPEFRFLTGTKGMKEKGFTLIELLIVVALIGIIVTVAAVQYKNAIQKAKEAVLKEDLYILRDCIDQYYADKGKYPTDLQVLVEEKYIRVIPTDPMTKSADTWQFEYSEITDDPMGEQGIIDVRSGAEGVGLDGVPYSEW
ncbi:MAG: type II secretion system protein [Acidobacteriota bacterium]